MSDDNGNYMTHKTESDEIGILLVISIVDKIEVLTETFVGI